MFFKNVSISIYQQEPQGFVPGVKVCACYVHAEGRVLLLQRAPIKKEEPGKWELPGGKLEEGEALDDCMSRELFEETGLQKGSFTYIAPLYVKKPNMDFVFHLYRTTFDKIPEIVVSSEHQGFMWALSDEIKKMNLVSGEDILFSLYS